MANLATFLFEGAEGDGWGTVVDTHNVIAIDTAVFIPDTGAQSLYVAPDGVQAYQQVTLGAGKRVIVARFYFRIKTAASGSSAIWTVNSSISFTLQLRATNKLRCVAGTTTGSDSATTLSVNTWYRIDVYARHDNNPGVMDYAIDGVDQAGATSQSVAAADFANYRLGHPSTNTYQVYFDDLQVNDAFADYPIGGYSITPDPTAATGTGAASAATLSLKPTAGNPAGTGAASAPSRTVSAPIGTTSGTGAALQPTVIAAASTNADAGLTSGTGAAANAAPGLGAGALAAAGTGAANTPSVSFTAAAQATTGTGAAYAPAPFTIGPGAQVAAGTGSALAAGATVGYYAAADIATGTGATFTGVSDEFNLLVGLVTGSGAASNATVATAANTMAAAGNAGAAGTALDAGVSLGLAVDDQAVGVGEAYDAGGTLLASVQAASGTGTAPSAAAQTFVTAAPDFAAGDGEAFDAAPTIQIQTSANAGLTAGTGVATDGGVSVEVTAEIAEGFSDALGASPLFELIAELAGGIGTAYDVVGFQTAEAQAGVAAGTGSVPAVGPAVIFTSGVASGTGATVSATTNAILSGLGPGPSIGFVAFIRPQTGIASIPVPDRGN